MRTDERLQALVDQDRIEQFLYHEARLLDERRFEEWLALWTDDGIYWVPANGDGGDPDRNVSLVYDSRERLETRLERYASDLAHSQNPPPRTSRVIANVETERADDRWIVHSSFQVAEARSGMVIDWAGRTTHHLADDDEGLQISAKQVVLVNNDQELTAIEFPL